MTTLYIDPGSSSFIIQAIAASALGAVLFIKNFGRAILSFFTGKKQEKNNASTKEL